jgi:hypothetical protein
MSPKLYNQSQTKDCWLGSKSAPLSLRVVARDLRIWNWIQIEQSRREKSAGAHVNTLERVSVASLALASVADARSQIARMSSDGVVVKDTWTTDLERRAAISEVKENTDHGREIMLSARVVLVNLVAHWHITVIRITPSGALVVG